MKKLTEECRKLCSMQAKIFEASAELSNSSSAVFVRRFMRSDLAKRIDDGSFLFESSSTEQIVAALDNSSKNRPYGSEKYSANEMHWMGYVYRCWCCLTGDSSKTAYRIIGARELRELYYPYHSLDAAQAVERIMEAKGIALEEPIEKGVRLLKAIRGL